MMINVFEITKQEDIAAALSQMRRSSVVPHEIASVVKEIIDAVATGGDEAIIEMTERFDGVSLARSQMEVGKDELLKAYEALPGDIRSALKKSEKRITRFAVESLSADWERETAPGVMVGQLQRPMDPVGIYVPGGRFAYPSTVLMTGVPAREAGVENIIFCIPPERGEQMNDAALAATLLVGECRVFRVGGAQAVTAMALGTENIPKCQMVAGPGNVYVTTAKRLLSEVVAIDLQAGPSEVAVYVDGSVDISYATSDMLAQLEHDPLAVAVMVSESKEVLESAMGELEGLTSEVGSEGTANLVLCTSGKLATQFINRLAPEHLELMVESAREILPDIKSAGCVFIGPYSPVVLGDYLAGPSHVLPTGGSAIRLSGLSAQSFRRTMNVISYTKKGFLGDSDEARALARLEGLEIHALSIDVRLKK